MPVFFQMPPVVVPPLSSVFRLKVVRLLHSVVELSAPASGAAWIVIEAVVLNAVQAPLAAMAYVTVYVPGVVVARFTLPFEALIARPAGALYVPPGAPVRVTEAEPELQKGDP